MTWNHRVVKRRDKTIGEDYYAIHECFYDVDGKMGWTEQPIQVIGEDLDSLRWTLEKMMLALDRPVIEDTE